MVMMERARVAKAAAAQLRYKAQMEATRRRAEEKRLALDAERKAAEAAEAEAQRQAEADRVARLEEQKRREAAKEAEEKAKADAAAAEAARLADAMDAELAKRAAEVARQKEARAAALREKGAELDVKIDKAKRAKQEQLVAKWRKGEVVKQQYASKIEAQERATQEFVQTLTQRRKAREERQRQEAGDLDLQAQARLAAIAQRFESAEQRAARLRQDREARAAEAAAGKSESELQRREKLQAYQLKFKDALERRLSRQAEAERRRQEMEAERARELADMRLRAEIREAETADRLRTAEVQADYRRAQTAKKIGAEDEARRAQLRAKELLEAERRAKIAEEIRAKENVRAKVPTPGPLDLDNRFFSLGKLTTITTGAVPKANGPAWSMGVRKQVLAAPPSETPAPNRYVPNWELLEKKPAASFGRRYPLPKQRDAEETPGPMDYAPSTSSLERTKMRRGPTPAFDSPVEARARLARAASEGPEGRKQWRMPMHYDYEFSGPQIPGPGNYDVSKWRTDHSPHFSFGGKGVRNPSEVAKIPSTAPGPASYNPKYSFISSGLSF